MFADSAGESTLHTNSHMGEISCKNHIIAMAAPLWTLMCQTKSNDIQTIAKEMIKVWIFYIYMNTYLYVQVFIFVPRVKIL